MADRLGVLINILVSDDTLVRVGRGNLSRFFKMDYIDGDLVFKSANITMTVTLKQNLQKIINDLFKSVSGYKLSMLATILYVSDALLFRIPYDYPIVIANNDTLFDFIEYKNRSVLYAYNKSLNYPNIDLKLTSNMISDLSMLKEIGNLIDTDKSTPYYIKSKLVAIISYIGYYKIAGRNTIVMILSKLLDVDISAELVRNIIQYVKYYSKIVNNRNKYIK